MLNLFLNILVFLLLYMKLFSQFSDCSLLFYKDTIDFLYVNFISYISARLFFCCCCSLGPHTARGSSQARGRIGATAASLHHSHSNMGSEPCLQPTPQLLVMPDPPPTERDQGSNPHPHRY